MKKIKILVVSAIIVFAGAVVFGQNEQLPNRKALDAVRQRDFDRAISILDDEIRSGTNVDASYRLRFEVKSMAGDFAGAVADLDKLIALKPQDGELYMRRAELKMSTKAEMSDILGDLDQAIVHGVKQQKVYRLRGFVRSSRGDLDGAINDYQTAISLDPGYAPAYQGIASVFLRKGDSAKAIQTLEGFIASVESAEKKPGVVRGTVVAAASVELPSRGDNGAVRRDTIITTGPVVNGEPMTREQLAILSDRMEQSRNTSFPYATLADLYNRRGDHQRAIDALNKAVTLDPTNFLAFAARGRVNSDLGNYAGAIADFDRSISINPHSSMSYLDRGIANLMTGREADAQKDFDAYLERFPKGKSMLDRRVEAAKNKLKN